MRDENFIEGNSHLAEMQVLGGVASTLRFSVELGASKLPKFIPVSFRLYTG